MGSESVTVSVSPSTEVTYTVRSLRNDDPADLSRWSTFCASCFANKANPPTAGYFERHFYNDPRRDASAIHIVEFEGDDGKVEVVSSVRVFQRTVSDGSPGGTMKAGGIGEVCTHPDHRRRGLSKLLLTKAIGFMERCEMETSLLHAAASITAVYEKNGDYKCTTSRWSVASIDRSKLAMPPLEVEGRYVVRLAKFPADTARLRELHKAYSEGRFAGCVVRTEEYWNEYVSREIGDSLFVLAEGGGEGSIVAWMSVRPRVGRFQLREFGVARGDISHARAVSMLLGAALGREGTADEGGGSELHLPTAVLDELKSDVDGPPSFVCWDDVRAEDDIGWMYRPIVQKGGRPSMVELTESGGRPHLIWPTDSF